MRMLYALAAGLLIVWFAAIATSQTFGGYVHLLLVFSIIIVLTSLVLGERRS